MSRRPARATQADITRAIRAVQQTDARMEVLIQPDGTIRIVPADHSSVPATVEPKKRIVF